MHGWLIGQEQIPHRKAREIRRAYEIACYGQPAQTNLIGMMAAGYFSSNGRQMAW
jgi:hypothetical protein